MSIGTGASVFGRWLKEHCGRSAHEKHVPAVIMRHEDPHIRRAFINGLTDGDGHRCPPQGRKRQRWTVATSSQALMHDLILLLAQEGLGCFTQVRAQRLRHLRGTPMPTGMLYGVTWNLDGPSVSTRLLNGKTIPSRSERWRSDSEGVWYPIKRLTTRPFEGEVFNLTTVDHTYVAGGYLVHNCDLAINDDLAAAGVPLPEGALTPATFGLDEGSIEEAYYAALTQKKLPPGNGPTSAGS